MGLFLELTDLSFLVSYLSYPGHQQSCFSNMAKLNIERFLIP